MDNKTAGQLKSLAGRKCESQRREDLTENEKERGGWSDTVVYNHTLLSQSFSSFCMYRFFCVYMDVWWVHWVRWSLESCCQTMCLWSFSVSLRIWVECVCVWSPVAVMWRRCSDLVWQVQEQTGISSTHHYMVVQVAHHCHLLLSFSDPSMDSSLTACLVFLSAERLLFLMRGCKILRKRQREGESGG